MNVVHLLLLPLTFPIFLSLPLMDKLSIGIFKHQRRERPEEVISVTDGLPKKHWT